MPLDLQTGSLCVYIYIYIAIVALQEGVNYQAYHSLTRCICTVQHYYSYIHVLQLQYRTSPIQPSVARRFTVTKRLSMFILFLLQTVLRTCISYSVNCCLCHVTIEESIIHHCKVNVLWTQVTKVGFCVIVTEFSSTTNMNIANTWHTLHT